MKQQTDSGKTTGNHSEANPETRLQIISVDSTGRTIVASYVTKHALDRPLKVFDSEPTSFKTFDKLPKRYADVFEKSFSKQGSDPEKASQRTNAKEANS